MLKGLERIWDNAPPAGIGILFEGSPSKHPAGVTLPFSAETPPRPARVNASKPLSAAGAVEMLLG